MAAMTMGDYGKDAPSGGGIRLRILYDAIVNRELIDVESGGKALIMTCLLYTSPSPRDS